VLTLQTPPEWTLEGVFRGGGFRPPQWINGKLDYHYPVENHSSLPPQRVSQLFVVDIHTKEARQLTYDEGQYFTPEWSPNGTSIVCTSTEGRPLAGEGSGPTNLYLVDVDSGKKRALTSDAEYKRMPHWAPNGNWIAYFSARNLNYQFASIVPAAGGSSIPITETLDRDIQEINWLPDSKSIVVTYADGVSEPIVRVTISDRKIDPISGTEPAARLWTSVSRSGMVAWVESNGSSYGRIIGVAPDRKSPYVLFDPNPQIADWILGKQEIIRWKNSRGDHLEGVLIKPADYHERRTYPLIVDGYPALKNGFKGDPMWGNQVWASLGYAVFFPDPRGPHVWMNPFRSPAFTSAGKGPAGLDVMVDDMLSGVDKIINDGIVDPDRMALYGFSNGGAVVEQVVTKTARFKCAVAVGGATSVDWPRRFFLHTLEPWTSKLADTTPWVNPETYIQLSAVYRLDHVRTPMLLADGDDDGDFLLNTIEMYNGLRWLGRDVTFIRYPGQGHGFTGWAMQDFWERETAFFAEYLKPDVQ
jgi:dipeptidyl aminopeptidase/acylaminoacyl peptidase